MALLMAISVPLRPRRKLLVRPFGFLTEPDWFLCLSISFLFFPFYLSLCGIPDLRAIVITKNWVGFCLVTHDTMLLYLSDEMIVGASVNINLTVSHENLLVCSAPTVNQSCNFG